MSKHVYNDGKGEVRIYSALKGCTCSWCDSQRHAQRQGSASARKLQQGFNEDGAQMLLTYAGQIAQRKRIPLSAALAEARQQFPAVAEAVMRQYAAEEETK